MKLVDKMKDENLGLAILYNFTKGYGHVPMSVYDVVLPFLYHDGFRNHLFEGVEVEEALTKCVQEDASFIQNILDTIEIKKNAFKKLKTIDAKQTGGYNFEAMKKTFFKRVSIV